MGFLKLEIMKQEVQYTLKITLEVDATIDKEVIRKELETDFDIIISKSSISLAPYLRKNILDGYIVGTLETVSIKEEAEIYGND